MYNTNLNESEVVRLDEFFHLSIIKFSRKGFKNARN